VVNSQQRTFPLQRPTTLIEAIAQAGGPQDGARQNVVEIRRVADNGVVTTKVYNLEKSADAGAEIQTGDVIFVPYAKQRSRMDLGTVLGALGSLAILFGRR
jgi:protein involved in polysaccharide export with SLBB domain